jgi:D-alanine-D-alanine ligase-like ATP-grasp enzyme
MENITQEVHPENRSFAEMAAAAFGLDLAGVDMGVSETLCMALSPCGFGGSSVEPLGV